MSSNGSHSARHSHEIEFDDDGAIGCVLNLAGEWRLNFLKLGVSSKLASGVLAAGCARYDT